MEKFIGTKMVHAEPAWRFTDRRGDRTIQPKSDKKVLVFEGTYEQEDGYKVVYPDGYESWSPKDVFEEAYRKTDGMNFGLALEAAKKGERIARRGWNGKRMYVFLAQIEEYHTAADISEFYDCGVETGDCLILRTAQGTLQPGWLASQADMLADDWYILE